MLSDNQPCHKLSSRSAHKMPPDIASEVEYLLSADKGDTYVARFNTNSAFQNVRIPFSAFRKNESSSEEAPQILRPQDMRKLGILAEYRNRPNKALENGDISSLTDRSDKQFKLEINRIHVSFLFISHRVSMGLLANACIV